jgi:NAD(P)-dependent dehydrogenase (short-subunit alcohol dehydrogenase family)
MRALAVDHGRDGIRVNYVCPSIPDTQLVRNALNAGPEDDLSSFGLDGPAINFPEQVARHTMFLASTSRRT